jgi:large subunit ribosomal protein L3
MSSLFLDNGNEVPVTLLQISNAQVLYNRTKEKNGYTAVAVGIENVDIKKLNKPQKKMFEDNSSIEPKRHVKEFRVDESNLLEVGQDLNVSHFKVGQFVDVAADTIGRGFSGAMKRWNFRGLEATHGVSISHRSHGSTGGRQDPGRVFKNKKMAGHYGTERVTVQNLQVLQIIEEDSLLVIKGNVPGYEGAIVEVIDAVKMLPIKA